jgi:hypothetical protein
MANKYRRAAAEPQMRWSQARAIVAAAGCSIRRTPYDEFRVNFHNGGEGTAYYTSDLGDAVATALAMLREGLGGGR